MKQIEIEKGKVDFGFLWKIGKIDIDRVTFVKYGIERTMSMNEGKENVVLKEAMGDETYKCYPSVIEGLSGKVGEVIKGFVVERKGRNVRVSKIMNLDVVFNKR